MKTPHKQRKLFQNLLAEGLQLFHTKIAPPTTAIQKLPHHEAKSI
ncbi:hypothetical protein [Methanobacterium arcticum]|nr:hypothetical protein [Methanobacterium arcticum]